MRVAAVTPYLRELDDILLRCIDSVRAQTVSCCHYLIADSPGRDWVGKRVERHVALGEPHRDYGNTPRGIGALLAISEGADAIAFLDTDNLFDPDHVEICLNAAKEGLDYVVARRRIALPDGTPVICQDEPGHVDTNCFFFLPGSFHTLPRWVLQPRPLAILGDRLFLSGLGGLKYAVTNRPTVTYTSNWRVHYQAAGMTPPADAKSSIDGSSQALWWRGLSPAEQIVVRRLLSLPGFNI